MPKTDLKRELKHLYAPRKGKFGIVDVPEMSFLMIDGHGDPNTSLDYQETVNALYAMAYTLKFASKALGQDFAVMPLEGLWWMRDMSAFSLENKDRWDWTMMIVQPEWVTSELVEAAREQVARKKDPPALPRIRFDTYHEGPSVQTMYVGPYDEEHETIMGLHAFAEKEGYVLSGKHHEIYLSDPRRSAPDKLKTVIRQPVAKPQATKS